VVGEVLDILEGECTAETAEQLYTPVVLLLPVFKVFEVGLDAVLVLTRLLLQLLDGFEG